MQLKADELKSIRLELKKAIKGRPLYFALMAPGSKKGKFKLSKKKGDTKPADFKKNFSPYEDDKDNNLKGTACQGVVTGEKGVLTFHPQNKPPGAALKFLDHFILREVKFKQVKDVVFAEPSESLPEVPDESSLDQPTTNATLVARLEQLRTRLAATENPPEAIGTTLDQAEVNLNSGQLESAEEALDEAEDLFDGITTEHVASVTDIPVDMDRLRSQLSEAKEKAGRLPPGLLSNLTQLISTANTALDGTDHEAAEDAVFEVNDAIDGAYQDFFLSNLRLLVQAQGDLPPEVNDSLDVVKRLVARRTWTEAMDAFERFKKLLGDSMAAAAPDPEAPVPPAPALSAEDAAEVRDSVWTELADIDISADLVRSAANRVAQSGTVADATAFLKEVAEAVAGLEEVEDEPEPLDLSAAQAELILATQTWQAMIDDLSRTMLSLANALRNEADEDSVAVGDEIESMLRDFPPALGAFLPSLEKAVRIGKEKSVETLSKLVKNEVKLCSSYLQSNKTYLTACENNPYDVDVEIEKPLTAALKAIVTCLQAI